ncbi:MAG: DUF3450 domain-containing protein [Pseudomonadota bacterium]
MTKFRLLGSAVAAAALVAGGPAYAQLSSAISTSQQAASETAQSQDRINDLDDETARLLQDYRAELKQLEQLQRYNASLRRQIDSQEVEIVELSEQIDAISGLQRSVAPLMEDMLASLEQFVAADIPFLADERTARIGRLNAAMSNPSLSPAQRYRLIVEAYEIENEYGRTIEAYEDEFEVGGELNKFDVLRIGRVSVIRKTADDGIVQIYSRTDRAWVDLDRSLLPDVKIGFRMAKEQIPPNLLGIPVTAPTSGQ